MQSSLTVRGALEFTVIVTTSLVSDRCVRPVVATSSKRRAAAVMLERSDWLGPFSPGLHALQRKGGGGVGLGGLGWGGGSCVCGEWAIQVGLIQQMKSKNTIKNV